MNEFFTYLMEHLNRIFWGESSWTVIFELFFRTTVLYLYSFFLVRLIGKRGLSSLAPFELAVIIIIGSIVGSPMLDSQVPLIHGMVVLTVVVGMQRLFVHMTEHNKFFEHILEGNPQKLVQDGLINVEALHREGFSQEDLFIHLREKGIEHLGEVKAAFIETTGRVSVWKKKQGNLSRPSLESRK